MTTLPFSDTFSRILSLSTTFQVRITSCDNIVAANPEGTRSHIKERMQATLFCNFMLGALE
jgi:hypothetical protein